MPKLQSQLIKTLSSSEVIVWAMHNTKALPAVNCTSFSRLATGMELDHVVLTSPVYSNR